MKKNQKVFLYTSMWILIPLYNSNNILFNFSLFFNFLFSCLYWIYYNNIFHNFDRFFSILTLIITKNIYIILILYIFLYYGKNAIIENNINKHIIYHSIFRYISFWICCYYINHYNITIFILYSIIYIFHIILILNLLT